MSNAKGDIYLIQLRETLRSSKGWETQSTYPTESKAIDNAKFYVQTWPRYAEVRVLRAEVIWQEGGE
jgi:hypothetical protein